MVLLPLKPWGERSDTAAQIVQRLRMRTQDMPGVRVVPRAPGGLGGGGKPVQIVLQGSEFEQVAAVAERVSKVAFRPQPKRDQRHLGPRVRAGGFRGVIAQIAPFGIAFAFLEGPRGMGMVVDGLDGGYRGYQCRIGDCLRLQQIGKSRNQKGVKRPPGPGSFSWFSIPPGFFQDRLIKIRLVGGNSTTTYPKLYKILPIIGF